MAKTLLIMRHGKSSWDDPALSDHDRPLADRGKREAELMGRELKRRGLVPDVILTSTAKRARSTAKRVMRELGVDLTLIEDRRLYASTPALCLLALAEQAQGETVLLIGHNPTLDELVAELTAEAVSLSTASVAVIHLSLARWADLGRDVTGDLVSLLSPRGIDLESQRTT